MHNKRGYIKNNISLEISIFYNVFENNESFLKCILTIRKKYTIIVKRVKTNIMKNNEKAEGDNYADNCLF